MPPVILTSYTYDEAGNQLTQSDAEGRTTSWVYDALGRVSSRTLPLGQIETYQYDANSNQTSRTDFNGQTHTFAYDNMNRMTSATYADGSVHSYVYDAEGNRTQGTEAGITTGYSYDDKDRLVQQGGVFYTYDANGNTLQEDDQGTPTFYGWNSLNQLVEHTAGGVTSQYEYNSEGIRHSQTNPIMSTDYLVDSNRNYAQVLAETVDGATDVVYHFGDDLISQDRDSGTHYFHVDGLGSTRVLTDSAGSSTDSYAYAAFGEVLNQSGLTENDYLYTGEQYDEGLGQYYLRARYYDQGVGRFSRMDDWMGDSGSPTTLNKYLYADSSPVNYIDPTGRFSIARFSAGAAVLGKLTSLGTSKYSPFGSAATESIGNTASHIDLGENPKFGEVVESCFSEHYGEFGENMFRAVIGVGAIPIYKPWAKLRVIGNASKFTNFISASGHWKFRGANLNFRLLGTKRIAGAAGRANIIAGSGVAAYDITSVALCVNHKY